MWKDFGVKCVNWSTFCILDEYPRAGVDALTVATDVKPKIIFYSYSLYIFKKNTFFSIHYRDPPIKTGCRKNDYHLL